MTESEFATELGNRAAEAATWVEKKAGTVGWIMSWICLAAAANTGEFSAFCAALCFTALALASLTRRTPARWLEELGFSLGLKAAAIYGAFFLFVRVFVDRSDEVLLAGFASSVVLALGAGLQHPEQARAAWLKLLRFLNGASDSTKPRNVFSCAAEPFLYGAIFTAAFVSMFQPHLLQHGWNFVMQHGPPRIDPFSHRVLPPPGWSPVLNSRIFWSAVAAVSLLMSDVAFRRLGLGLPMRGFWVWLSAMGQVWALVIGSLCVIFQIDRIPLAEHAELLAVAFLCAVVVWFCHTRRRKLRGEPLGWNFHWWSTADAN